MLGNPGGSGPGGRCWSGPRRYPGRRIGAWSTRATPTTVRGRSLCSSGMKGARLGKAPMRPSSLGPGVAGQLAASKQDRHNVLEGSTARRGRTQPRDGDKPAGRNNRERLMSPVSVYPAAIAARAGSGVAEPLVVGRRLVSAGDGSGVRTRRDFRGEGGSMQGQNRGVRLETPPGPPARAVGTEDIRPEAEIPRGAWVGSRRGPYERRRAVMRPEQRAPTSAMLSRGRRHSVIADKAQHTRSERVRVLQRKLYRAAKEAPQRKFGVLYDKVYRRDVLEEAWRRVRRNRGSAGVDKQTIAAVEGVRGRGAARRARSGASREAVSPATGSAGVHPEAGEAWAGARVWVFPSCGIGSCRRR